MTLSSALPVARAPNATDIPHPLATVAAARPHHPVLVTDECTWNAQELLDAVTRTAGALALAGVRPREVVALAGPPSAEWVIAFHALGWLGATVAPLPWDHPDSELHRALDSLAPARILTTAGLQPATSQLLASRTDARVLEIAALPAAPHAPERFWPWDERRLLVLSSGSTGTPRVVPLTTAQWVLSAFASAIRLGHERDDRWLLCLPLHHIGGLGVLMRACWYGTTVLMHPRFVASRVARALDLGEATMVSLVPTMLERILELRTNDPFPPSVRVVLVGGAATPRALAEQCRDLGIPLATSWGMTEAGSQIATREPGELADLDHAGAPLPFVRVESVDGLLVVRGPLVGGELVSRDEGHLDALGRVVVAGRRDDTIVSGGENISARELEVVLCKHPAIASAYIVGVPSARWGERPCALLVQKPQTSRPDDAELTSFCKRELAPFKVPDHFVWVDEQPTGSLGKRSRARALEILRPLVPELASHEPKACQAVDESARHHDGLEGRAIDGGVDEFAACPHGAVTPGDRMDEGQRARSHTLELDPHGQALGDAHRPLIVALDMHEWKAPRAVLEELARVAKGACEQLFPGLVAILKDPAKEDDAHGIDVEEPYGELVLKGQARALLCCPLEVFG